MTRDEIKVEVSKIVDDTLELAAAMCEKRYPEWVNGREVSLPCFSTAQECADAIRALKGAP